MKELDIEEMKHIEVNILKYIKKICKKNKIDYYICSGTLLGAIKYHGFIPWDDDIDIAIKRENYEKLVKCIEEDNDSQYKILTYKNTKDYYYPYAKVVDTRTIVIDNGKRIKEMGVFVDVFPVDYYNEDIEEIHYKSKFIRNMCSKRMRIVDGIEASNNKEKQKKKVKYKLIKDMVYNFVDLITLPLGYNYWCKLLEKKLVKYKDGKYCGILYFDDIEKFDKTIVNETIELDFEKEKFTSIKDYECYLTTMYGDYRKDLPKELQVTHHTIKAYYKEGYNEKR